MSVSDLPLLNACLNSAVTILLITGYRAIRRGARDTHRNCMVTAVILSAFFLVSYVYYHYTMARLHGQAHTRFLNPPWFRPIYLTILFTHLTGAVVIIPMIIVTVVRAARGRFEQHRRIARWTWPIWLYVSVTGVLIYVLLYQVFPQQR